MQATVTGGYIDPAFPDGDAAVHQIAAGVSAGEEIALGIVAPDFAAGGRIDGIDVSPGAGGIHDAVDDEGCGFLSPLRSAQVILPRKAQIFDVRCVDDVERRIVGSVLVAPAGVPILGLSVRGL